jgi:hypothetical protein
MFQSFFSNLLKWDIWIGAFITFIIPYGVQKISYFIQTSIKPPKK